MGWTLAANDVSGDDVSDLIIGAPFAPSGGEQRGFAAAIFSATRTGLWQTHI